MCQRFQWARLAPDDFAVDAVQLDGERVQIHLRSNAPFGSCPDCGRPAIESRVYIDAGLQTRRLAAEASS